MHQADTSFGQSLLDTLPAHIAVIDADGKIVAVNRAWSEFAASNGDPENSAVSLGVNYLDVARSATSPYNEDGLSTYSGIQEILNGSRSQFSLEYSCDSPTQQRWFLLTVSALDVTPRQAVISHLDITSRKLLEQQLREDEVRLQDLVRHLHQALWIIDVQEAKGLYVSPGYEALWGRSCQNLLEKPHSFLEGIHPDDQELMRRETTAMFLTGKIDVECRVLRPDGVVAWVWIRGYPVTDQGHIVRVVGVSEDITARKKAEDETGRLAAIIEFADDAIVSLTLNGIVISWNQGAERLYGYSAEEMIGRSIILLHDPDKHDEYLSVMARTRRGERVAAFETVRRRKDGTLIDVSLSASAIEVVPGQVSGTSKISHDITKMKMLEEQFRHAQKMEAIGILAGGVAHDFNNLLTVINGYSDLLISQLPDDAPMRAMLVEIYKAGERAGNLTRQLLAFSRKQMLAPKVLSLNAIVTDTEMMLCRLIGEDIVLTSVLAPALKPILVDPGQIQQVLTNLAVNARDAMPRGGHLTFETRQVVLDEAYVQMHLGSRVGEYAMVAVTDTGMGMDEATKEHIFEPFFTTKEPGKGTGLGLAVVHGIVTQSGGLIEVDSEVGHGTTFKIYFPIAKSAVTWATASIGGLTMPKGTETLLLVEDENAVLELSRHILSACGYIVLEAGNGAEAIQVFQSHKGKIDLVVSDVVMPLIGGIQMAEQLETLRPGVKILFLSGYTDEAVMRHGISESDVAFLQKPFSPSTLAQKVREVLDEEA